MSENSSHINCDNVFDKYILVIDIGTTNFRCHIYNKSAQLVANSCVSIQLLYPKQGWTEINAQSLWEAFIESVKKAIQNGKLNINQISCIGISSLRGTFITWDRETGQPFHNFITWKDIRANKLCEQWNNSFRLKCLRSGAKFIHFFNRSNRFLAASLLRFTTGMVVMRLLWILENFPIIRERAVEGKAMFGTVDTYLIWRLTGGHIFATDPSNACVTGFYDPFLMCWANWAINMFNIPPSMLPIVQDTNGDYGQTLPEIFGTSIPIRAVVGDQQAAMFGECCFRVGDVKCTLGTGAFININTGSSPFASFKGLYPVVGWKLVNNEKPVYLAEGSSYDTGSAISWAQSVGLLDDPKDSSEMAISVSNDNLFFVPAFSGLQAPINDNRATAAFIGINPSTNKAQLVKAILESLCFRVKQMYEIILEEADFNLKQFRINGGVSDNDFVVQLIADLTGKEVERALNRDMSSLGTAFLAGLAIGFWKDSQEISKLRISEKVFHPRDNWNNHYKYLFSDWERAVGRCLSWNK